MAKSIYRKLTGRKRTFWGYTQLWLAPDHILQVKSMRLAEQYQRFALADIQSITVTQSPGRAPFQILAAVSAILWTLGFLAVRALFLKYFFAITGAVALTLILIDVLRGPRCRCYLTTAVSRELLRPVSRIRAAQSFLAIIQPAIEAVQGSLVAPEQMAMADFSSAAEKPPEVPSVPNYLPEVVFILFLLNAALILLALRFPKGELDSVLPTTFFAEIVLVVVALIYRSGRDPRRAIYVLMLFAVVGIGWDLVEIGRNVGVWINIVIQTGKQTTPLEVFNRAGSQRNAMISAAWRIVAGTTGLAAALFGRASK